MDHNSPTTSLEELLAHADWVQSLACQVVADPHHRDEVLQRTWLSAVERAPQQVRYPKAWLATVLRNAWLRLRRDESLRATREAEAPPGREAIATDEVVQQATLHRQVVDAVLDLGEPSRTTLLLRYFEQLSPQEIAAKTNVSIETTRTRLKRARASLKKNLEAQYGGDPRALSLALLPLWSRALSPGTTATAGAGPIATSASTKSFGFVSFLIGGVIVSTKLKIALPLIAILLALIAFQYVETTPTKQDLVAGSTPTREDSTSQPPRESTKRPTPSPIESVSNSPENSQPRPSASAPTAPAPHVIQGVILGAEEQPVEGALVVLANAEAHNASLSSEVMFGRIAQALLRGDIPSGLRTATTGPSGTFAFSQVESGLLWSVAALHANHGATLLTGIPVSEELSPVQVELQFEGGLALVGQVTDATGAPVADCHVNVAGYRDTADGWSGTAVASTRTDEQGMYQVHPLPYPQLRVSASHRDHCSARGELIQADSIDDARLSVDLVMGAKERLRGLLVDENDNAIDLERSVLPKLGPSSDPLLSRLVLAGTHMDPRKERRFDPQSHHVVGQVDFATSTYQIDYCGRDGRFVSVWVGQKLLGVSEVGDSTGPPITIDASVVDEQAPLDGSLTLRVLDGATREPVPSFEVQVTALRMLVDPRSQRLVHRFQGSAGHYVSSNLPYGLHEVVIQTNDYAPHRESFVVSAAHKAETHEILLLKPSEEIRGKIVDNQGNPVHDAKIHLCLPDGTLALARETSRSSNLDGEFEFTRIAAGEYLIGVEAVGLAAAIAWANTEDDSRLEISLEKGVKIEVRPKPASGYSQRVLDQDEVPVYDDRRTGSTHFGGSSVRLLEGETYTIEIYSLGHEIGRKEFRAEDGQKLTLDLVPLEQ